MDAKEDLGKTIERLEEDVNKISEIAADTIMRIAALERVLIKDGVISEEAYEEVVAGMQHEMIDAVQEAIAKRVQEEVSS